MTNYIRHVRVGERPSAMRENRVADRINELSDANRPRAFPVDTNPFDALQFYVTDVSGTVLQAITGSNAPVGGETIFDIRLPPELIETSRDGVTITITDVNNATATDGTDNETWKMVKPYAVGDVIEAFLWETDGVYVDRNIAARMWAAIDVLPPAPPFTA